MGFLARSCALLAAAGVLVASPSCAEQERAAAPVDPREAVERLAPRPAAPPPQAPPIGAPADDYGLPPQVPLRASGGAHPGDVRVIRGWLAAQRDGDDGGAARSWRLPSRFQDGAGVVLIDRPEERRALVARFGCGARLARAGGAGAFVVVRMLPVTAAAGRCGGPARDEVVRAAIRIGDGVISEYYRLPADPRTEPPRQKPHPAPGIPWRADGTA